MIDKLRFHIDWESGEGMTTPELRATMARLVIGIGDEAITKVLDAKTASVRDYIYVPLYPIAEWIATNWFSVLYEPDTWVQKADIARHDLGSASEGFAFPTLVFAAEGRFLRAQWRSKGLANGAIRFLESGEAYLERDQVKEALAVFIRAVITRIQGLVQEAPTLLEEEWQSIEALDDEERQFCKALGAMGKNPFETTPEEDAEVIAAGESLPWALQEEFFASVPFNRLTECKNWIERASGALNGKQAGGSLLALKTQLASDVDAHQYVLPWERGYRIAQLVREHLGLPVAALREQQIDKLGWQGAVLFSENSYVLSGLASQTVDRSSAQFVVTGKRKDSQRFCFARTLYEYLTANAFPRLVSTATTYAQKESRAFAAELLAPAAGIREQIGDREKIRPEDFEEMAVLFGVSEQVIEKQILNHRLADILP